MKYRVQKGVALKRHIREFYPFRDMQVGDSFAVNADDRRRVRSASVQYANRFPGTKFTTRIVDPIKKTYRCWRIA